MARPPRLIYGFLSQSTDPINMSLPWSVSERDGMFKMNYSVVDAMRDNLILWAHTNWGDRPMRFEYGLDALRYLFEQESIAKDQLENNAKNQLSKYFPSVKIEELQILTSDDDPDIRPNQIRFKLVCSIANDKKRKIHIDEIVGT